MPAKRVASRDKIRIRMYRVGFGDCFLITLPTPGGPRHILVDCGVHTRGNIHTIGKAVEDIEQVTERNLDVIIATHAHQDHISGFGDFASKFALFKVQEVWLPWIENPDDPAASKLKKKQLALIENLVGLNPAAQLHAEDRRGQLRGGRSPCGERVCCS